MLHPDSHVIKDRFFAAIDLLIKRHQLKGRKSFATRYELNWGNFYQLRKDPKLSVELAYLNWLVIDFGISARWLLTGEGDMFARTRPGQDRPGRDRQQPNPTEPDTTAASH